VTTAIAREPELVAAERVLSTRPATMTVDAAVVERVLIHGDLRQLTPAQKISYYRAVCESVGLNPLTQPFQYLVLNGKEILYALRAATEQLRQIHSVSVQIMAREVMEDCYVVTARATLPTGRQDENIGVVPIAGLKGEARANAMMKAETKAKRRVTLAICGLGMLDETEVESIHLEAPAPIASGDVGGVVRAGGTAETPATSQTPTAAGGGTSKSASPAEDISEAATSARSSLAIYPPGVVIIERVDRTPTKNPKTTRYLITTSTGQIPTIKEKLGDVAEQCWKAHRPVRITTKTGPYGLEVDTLTPVDWSGSDASL
jgi:hypothetical protein